MTRRLLVCVVCVLLAALIAGPVSAQPRSGRIFGSEDDPAQGATGPRVVMRLDYTAPLGCPADRVFANTVAGRVRWVPFAPAAPFRLSVRVVRGGGGYEGAGELRDVAGELVWSRSFPAMPRCFDLIEHLALALALQIDPPRPPKPEPGGAPSLDAPPAPALVVPAPGPVKPSSSSVALRIGAGAWVDLATSPRPAAAVGLELGFRVAWFSLSVEGRAAPPAGASVGDGDVELSTARYSGGLLPCGHVSWFVGCLVAEFGAIQGTLTRAGRVVPEHVTSLYAAGGARLGVEVPIIPRRLFVTIAARLLGARKTTFLFNGAPQWATAPVVGSAGAGLLLAF